MGCNLRGRLHIRYCVRFHVRFRVRFGAKGEWYFKLCFVFPEMCRQTVEIGVRRRIGSISGLQLNCASNRTQNHTWNRTRVDGPIREDGVGAIMKKTT
jgi:hypothetical protein